MGATIVTVYGEDVALQMAEYAKTSGATKIVIGRNATKRSGIIRKPTLADKLIALATNIDIHIIPDADSDIGLFLHLRQGFTVPTAAGGEAFDNSLSHLRENRVVTNEEISRCL